MHNAINADDFLNEFMQRGIPIHDEVGHRCLTECDFGAELDNEENDVPLYDQYNRGLVATQADRPRLNLALEGNQCATNSMTEGNRPGVTGYIPSVEEGMEMGAMPLGKGAVVLDLNQIPVREKKLTAMRRGM
jgi:hypothetical protein